MKRAGRAARALWTECVRRGRGVRDADAGLPSLYTPHCHVRCCSNRHPSAATSHRCLSLTSRTSDEAEIVVSSDDDVAPVAHLCVRSAHTEPKAGESAGVDTEPGAGRCVEDVNVAALEAAEPPAALSVASSPADAAAVLEPACAGAPLLRCNGRVLHLSGARSCVQSRSTGEDASAVVGAALGAAGQRRRLLARARSHCTQPCLRGTAARRPMSSWSSCTCRTWQPSPL